MRASDRPGERRAATRTAVVWDGLRPVLDDGPRDVLDVGGGTGGFATKVAELGHRVSVVDPSPDALASLDRRARELGVRVAGHQGDLSDLVEIAGTGAADLVLCHGVLEVVDDLDAALAAITAVLRPGGTLSVLVAQRHSAVVARAMAGHFRDALELLSADATDRGGRGGRRFTAVELEHLLGRHDLQVVGTYGVRVFADLVPGSLLDLEPGATASLTDLELAVAGLPEYLPLAAQVHALARRPA